MDLCWRDVRRGRAEHADAFVVARSLVCSLDPSDVTVPMGSTGYNAVINSCKGISTPDSIICQSGTLACQKAASTGAAFKNMARQITTSTYNGTCLVAKANRSGQVSDQWHG